MSDPIQWEFDRRTHTVRLPNAVVELRGRQAQVFEYLYDRTGEIVSRASLQTDVWGLSSGVRSETVPVTLRKLRAALGPAGPAILHTFRGVGWRLVAPPRSTPSHLPRPANPYFERPSIQTRVDGLLAAGWRIVTLTGPGGAGKTRTLIHQIKSWSGPWIFVGLGSASNPAEALTLLLEASGMIAGGLDALVRALTAHPVLFAIDEAERNLPTVAHWVDALSDHRFLITSRQELDRPDEAVFELPPLHGAIGRAFARRTMQAARWQHAPSDATLDALLAAVDGLPLAIEVCAAQPEAPVELLGALRASCPVPGFDAFDDVLRRSIVDLPAPQRTLLEALCVPRGMLTTTEITSWLGTEAGSLVAVLAQRSLLRRHRQGWQMLHGIRRLVGAKSSNKSTRYVAWLVRYASELTADILRGDGRALDRVRALRADLMQCVACAPSVHLRDLVWMMLLAACHRGPLAVYRHALNLAYDRAPTDAFLTALVQLDRQSIESSISITDPTDLIRFWTVVSLGWLPVDPDRLPAPPQDVSGAENTALLARLQLPELARRLGDPVVAHTGVQAMLAAFPLLALHAELTVARLLINTGRHLEARVYLLNLQDQLETRRLEALGLTVWHGLAEIAAWLDSPAEVVAAAQRAHRESINTGWAWSWAAARPGVFLQVCGLAEPAKPMLMHGLRAPHRQVRALCEALLTAQAVEDGTQPVQALDRLDALELTTCMRDGTTLQAIINAQLMWTRMRINQEPYTVLEAFCLTLPTHQLLHLMRRRL